MLKLWGAGLITAAGVYGILLRKRENRTRKKQLCQWIELLETMASEIRWHHVSLIEFLQGQLLTSNISTHMKSKFTLQQSWEKTITETGDKAVEQVLQALHFSGDRESLLASIAHTIEQLRDLDNRRGQEAEKQDKIQSAAIFSVTGLLIILLL